MLTTTMNLENAAKIAIEELKALVENGAISNDSKDYESMKFNEIAKRLNVAAEFRNKNEKVDSVLKLLDSYEIKKEDLVSVKESAARLLSRDWTVEQVADYLQFTEEVQPELDEDIAFKLMRCYLKTHQLSEGY